MTDGELERFKFHTWLGHDAIHDIKTGDFIRHEVTEESKQICLEYWARGESPLQEFNKTLKWRQKCQKN